MSTPYVRTPKTKEQVEFERCAADYGFSTSWSNKHSEYTTHNTRVFYNGWKAGRDVLRAAIMGTD